MFHCTHCESGFSNVDLSAESPILTAVAMAHATATKIAGYFTVYSKYISCSIQFPYLQKMTKNQLNAAT
jgi:hypothetical protein